MIPVKRPAPAAVNKAFMLGAEAFARKPIAVQRALGAGGGVAMGVAGAGDVAGGVAEGGARSAGAVQRVLECDAEGSGAASPRLVQLGGLTTPRVRLRDRGRTESKQTILSSDTDSMTTVGT